MLKPASATTELDPDETTSVLEIQRNTKMNGNGNAKNGASSNTANDVKYPANCAMRLGSSPGGDEDNDLYEPKQNKKIWRILTVLVYVFTVSFGKYKIWSNTYYTIRISTYFRVAILSHDISKNPLALYKISFVSLLMQIIN